jgi:serine phosphatase RsbU (regulator of sigma subunit)/transcriptional regulator with GAF, ATPase, and Fis domain
VSGQPHQISQNHSSWKQLQKLGESLLFQDSLDSQKDTIVNTFRSSLNCDAHLWFSEPTEKLLKNKGDETHLTPLMQTALNQQQILISSSSSGNVQTSKKRSRKTNPVAMQPLESALFIAAPLLYNKTPLGVIQLSRPSGPVFSRDEINFVEGLATQSALLLQASQQISNERRQVAYLSKVHSVSSQIAELLDLDELVNRATQLIQATFNFAFVAIYIAEPDRGFLRLVSKSINPQYGIALENQELSTNIEFGQGTVVGYVAQNCKEIIIHNLHLYPPTEVLNVLPDTLSLIALPLLVGKRILGVLEIQSSLENAFQENDILSLHTLASNIAASIENSRLYGESSRRMEHMALVTEVSNAISSILELDDLLIEVLRLVKTRLGYPFAAIFSVHTGRRKIFLRASTRKLHAYEPSEDYAINLDDKDNPIAQASRELQLRVVDEIGEFVPVDEFPTATNQQYWVVPLSVGEEILGVLLVQKIGEKILGSNDQFLLEKLAGYIAIAMRNASLFRSEKWRRQVAESMREVAGLLTADATLDQVLGLILKELESTLPCDSAAIWLADTEENKKSIVKLQLAAMRLTNQFTSHLPTGENTLSPSEILHLLNTSAVPSPWLIEAFYSSQPKIRHQDEPYEPLGAILDFPASYSAIAAPLRLAGQPLGLLVLVHHTHGRFGHEAQSMTETFANYAAVAIENTRLYETAHDQAWVSTVLLQVAEATQTLNTLDELLSTMVRITPMLIGVNSCSFFLWDSNSDIFTLAASFGLSEELNSASHPIRISLGEIPVFDQLLIAKGPVLVDGDDLVSALSVPAIEKKSFVLFPMISHGEVLGALLVDYSANHENRLLGKFSNDVGWEEKFAIIQGIAHQTAISVENIHLLKAQKDEAYVSIALLQVAQAIVSLNALNEILEAIVRITPILVGVKRSLIYIWNSEKNVFHLAQSYGISKSELLDIGEDFPPDQFPMLEAIRKNNSIIYHSINKNTDAPLNWKTIDRNNFDILEQDLHERFMPERSDPNAESYLGKDHLKSQATLLYGFPLSVKGEVLGVMLTQEMEMASGYPSRQIREKRLEITVGITQQAAMAIQNDRLQKEVVERERLEREFQLAREIQQTFLPDSLPEHPGWDVFSLWRPARQVSGDFYDVIELPNNQWGLIIADVADKGMPAALYMTLIRSLIRAAINNNESSPASVLSRVNDLLVADSKSGMFVTLVYAVISLDEGTLLYANAGHNPPVLVRCASRELEKLSGTAMALGIFEGIKISQNQIRIDRGDSLIFYTDGITEAFSPHGVMFSENRLIDIIQNANLESANRIADSIDHAVLEFTEGDTSSDDITLVVLKRKTATP